MSQQQKNITDHPHLQFHIVSTSYRDPPYGISCTAFVVPVADIAVKVG